MKRRVQFGTAEYTGVKNRNQFHISNKLLGREFSSWMTATNKVRPKGGSSTVQGPYDVRRLKYQHVVNYSAKLRRFCCHGEAMMGLNNRLSIFNKIYEYPSLALGISSWMTATNKVRPKGGSSTVQGPYDVRRLKYQHVVNHTAKLRHMIKLNNTLARFMNTPP